LLPEGAEAAGFSLASDLSNLSGAAETEGAVFGSSSCCETSQKTNTLATRKTKKRVGNEVFFEAPRVVPLERTSEA
jgi:hypothetical protein